MAVQKADAPTGAKATPAITPLDPTRTVTLSGIPSLYTRPVKVFGIINAAIGRGWKADNLVVVRQGKCNVQFADASDPTNAEKGAVFSVKCLESKLMMWGFSTPLSCEKYKPEDNVVQTLNKKPAQGAGDDVKEPAGPSPPAQDTGAQVFSAPSGVPAATESSQLNQVGIFFLKKDITELHSFFTREKNMALLPHERYTFVKLTSVSDQQLSSYEIGKKVMIQVVGLYADGVQHSAIVQIKDTEISALANAAFPTVTLACSDQRVVPQNIAKEHATAVQANAIQSFQGTLGYLNAENRVVTQASG